MKDLKMTAEQINKMFLLFDAVREGVATGEQLSELDQMLAQDMTMCKYYTEYINMCALLRSGKAFDHKHVTVPEICNTSFWMSMAEYEKTASKIDVPKEVPSRELIQKVVYPPREKRKISRLGIAFLVMNSAAILLFALFLKFAPAKSVEVATLSDSLNAKWADTDSSMHKGTRLVNSSEKLMLRGGLAKLTFDNGTKAVIEAPAEFQILSEDRIGLTYGKVYTTVPIGAIGFSVYTPNTKIIDMGTEFGVQAEIDGDTQLHVYRGKTMLVAGKKDKNSSMEVGERVAKRIESDTQIVTDIPYNEKRFVRAFDSENNVVWRQHPSLDLADMVRNGNGLGTGNPAARLDPVKGFTTDWHIGIIAISNEYLCIPDHPFIDGIFVPDGETSQIISSRGDVFEECPDTSGLFDIDLFANPKPEMLKTELREGTIRFNGQEYTDESGKSCIIMHANHGLTFDLDAIRKSYNRNIDRFISRIGIADLNEPYPCNADFYVLVDGQIRYSLKQYKQKGILNDVSIEVNDTDRFLTLVTTDGGDPDYTGGDFYKRSISCDWCVFTDTVLLLEQ